jgi:hypothetical protein
MSASAGGGSMNSKCTMSRMPSAFNCSAAGARFVRTISGGVLQHRHTHTSDDTVQCTWHRRAIIALVQCTWHRHAIIALTTDASRRRPRL